MYVKHEIENMYNNIPQSSPSLKRKNGGKNESKENKDKKNGERKRNLYELSYTLHRQHETARRQGDKGEGVLVSGHTWP